MELEYGLHSTESPSSSSRAYTCKHCGYCCEHKVKLKRHYARAHVAEYGIPAGFRSDAREETQGEPPAVSEQVTRNDNRLAAGFAMEAMRKAKETREERGGRYCEECRKRKKGGGKVFRNVQDLAFHILTKHITLSSPETLYGGDFHRSPEGMTAESNLFGDEVVTNMNRSRVSATNRSDIYGSEPKAPTSAIHGRSYPTLPVGGAKERRSQARTPPYRQVCEVSQERPFPAPHQLIQHSTQPNHPPISNQSGERNPHVVTSTAFSIGQPGSGVISRPRALEPSAQQSWYTGSAAVAAQSCPPRNRRGSGIDHLALAYNSDDDGFGDNLPLDQRKSQLLALRKRAIEILAPKPKPRLAGPAHGGHNDKINSTEQTTNAALAGRQAKRKHRRSKQRERKMRAKAQSNMRISAAPKAKIGSTAKSRPVQNVGRSQPPSSQKSNRSVQQRKGPKPIRTRSEESSRQVPSVKDHINVSRAVNTDTPTMNGHQVEQSGQGASINLKRQNSIGLGVGPLIDGASMSREQVCATLAPEAMEASRFTHSPGVQTPPCHFQETEGRPSTSSKAESRMSKARQSDEKAPVVLLKKRPRSQLSQNDQYPELSTGKDMENARMPHKSLGRSEIQVVKYATKESCLRMRKDEPIVVKTEPLLVADGKAPGATAPVCSSTASSNERTVREKKRLELARERSSPSRKTPMRENRISSNGVDALPFTFTAPKPPCPQELSKGKSSVAARSRSRIQESGLVPKETTVTSKKVAPRSGRESQSVTLDLSLGLGSFRKRLKRS